MFSICTSIPVHLITCVAINFIIELILVFLGLSILDNITHSIANRQRFIMHRGFSSDIVIESLNYEPKLEVVEISEKLEINLP